MDLIDYSADKQVLLSVRGHPYDRNSFLSIFEQRPGYCITAVEQPATAHVLAAAGDSYEALVFYDMPGLDFHHRPPQQVAPPETLKSRFLALTEAGKGMVFLHHAIAGWPTWPEYGEIIGGRFHYAPAQMRGRAVPDSGYRHAVDYNVKVLGNHPVTAGIPETFPVTDELYLYEVFEADVVPLLVSDFDFSAENFGSAYEATGGTQPGDTSQAAPWRQDRGSNLVGWVKHYNNSPIVYLQMGDAPAVYDNPHYRQLIYNAIDWVCSAEAKAWAQARNA